MLRDCDVRWRRRTKLLLFTSTTRCGATICGRAMMTHHREAECEMKTTETLIACRLPERGEGFPTAQFKTHLEGNFSVNFLPFYAFWWLSSGASPFGWDTARSWRKNIKLNATIAKAVFVCLLHINCENYCRSSHGCGASSAASYKSSIKLWLDFASCYTVVD